MTLSMIIERNIEEFNSFENFDYVINLFSFHHLNRCRNGEDYIISLRQLTAVEMERAKLE